MRIIVSTTLAILVCLSASATADEAMRPLAKGVRGLVTRAKGPVHIDGRLDDWAGAFCTPVHDNHRNLLNRAARFFYLWDEQAFYVGLRALDQKQANVGQGGSVWNGDAVEFYFDTRAGDSLRGKDWTEGAIHLFYSPFTQAELKPRWVMRQGIATSDTKLDDVEIAATRHDWGYEIEFKIPWKNFPSFHAKPGGLIALDAELCSGDGGPRTDRTFTYGSPLSVQQPASLGLVELVESIEPGDLSQVGPAMFPMWVDTPWVQAERAKVQAVVAIPPEAIDKVGKVVIRLHDGDGKIVKEIPAAIDRFGPEALGFARAVATWSIDDFAPNTYFATARVEDRDGKTVIRVTPRMVQEANMTGR